MPTTISPRCALWALLGIALFLNYQMWSHDYPRSPRGRQRRHQHRTCDAAR